MIRRLRKRHFHVSLVLCLVVPLVFFLALTKREPIPTTASFPKVLDPVPEPLQASWESMATEGDLSVQLRTASNGTEWLLEVQPGDALAYPDVLVYVTDQPNQTLLEQAVLLGGMAGAALKQFRLPASCIGKDSQLRFYSLAHRSMILTHNLPASATTP